jgi:plasmid stabilization system protein ParE
MTKQWRVTVEAEADLDRAIDWYEAEREGLGAKFLESYRIAFESLLQDSAIVTRDHSVPSELHVFRCRLKVFPYAIVFTELPGSCEILSVTHLRRRPGHWGLRLVKPRSE